MKSYYRFRPLKWLLGDAGELETQTIYFAAQAELNDPMEGFAEVVFEGDRIVWENLLRHFIHCLAWAVTEQRLSGETRTASWDRIPWIDPANAPPIPLRSLVEATAERLVTERNTQKLLDFLARRDEAVSEDEIAMYLSMLHGDWVLDLVETITPGAIGKTASTTPALDLSGMIDQMEAAFAVGPSGTKDVPLHRIFAVSRYSGDEMRLVDRLRTDLDAYPNYRFVFTEFVSNYLQQIKKLMYPEWYTACFMEEMSNASVWGHYAGGHSDVCLKFRTTPSDGRHALDLLAPTRATSEGPTWSKRTFFLKPVTYGLPAVRRNFFESLGRLPITVLNRTWRTTPSGAVSPLVERMHKNEEAWRDRYWRDFEKSFTTKLPDWEYEKEHRLTLHSTFESLADKENRKLRYDFQDLEGIIFGMRTPEPAKLEIIRRVRKKCIESGRPEFSFSQAIRTPDGTSIKALPLRMLSTRGMNSAKY